MTPVNASSIDFGPLILALAGLITSFGGAIVWYVRSVLGKQSQLFDDALKRNAELQNALSATQSHNARLAENNRSLRDDMQELRDKITSLERRIDEIQGQRDTERRRADERALEYQNEIIDRDRKIKRLQDEISDLNKRFDVVNERLAAMNSDYAAVVTERDKLRKETEALAKLVARLQTENAAVTKHNGELDGKVHKLESDMAMMKAATAPSALDTAPHDNTMIVLEAKRKTNETLKIEPEPPPENAA